MTDEGMACLVVPHHGSTFTRKKPWSPIGESGKGLAAGMAVQVPLRVGTNDLERPEVPQDDRTVGPDPGRSSQPKRPCLDVFRELC